MHGFLLATIKCMQDRVTTSFIPKESLASERRAPVPRGNPFVIVNSIAGFVLVAALLGAGGAFLFKTYTETAIVSKQQSLERQRSAFEPATIRELSRLDKRIAASERLLGSHTSISLLFSELESRTIANVRFRNFKYETAALGKVAISMEGTARSFNAVALQSDAFSKSTIIKDPIFSNVTIDQSGNVVFSFSAIADTDRMSYAAFLATTPAAVEALPPSSVLPEGDVQPVPDAESSQP